MTNPKIAGIVRDSTGRTTRNAFFNATSAAKDRDIGTLLLAIAEMAEGGEAIPAENVAVLVRAAWNADPPRTMGRPPRKVETIVLRWLDGVAAIEGRELSQARSEREVERCKSEARSAFGPKLEGYRDEVDTE